jgi:replication factor C subunit 1
MLTILQREHIIQEITQLLTDYETNCKNIQFKKGIYIYGSPGCGKTRFVQDVLKGLNYDIVQYDAGDVRNKSLIDTITSNNMASQNVLQMMARKPKKIAIIMDEIDGMNNRF